MTSGSESRVCCRVRLATRAQRADNRKFVEAVLWIARTGSPWRDLPQEFGSWNSTPSALRAGHAPACGTGCLRRLAEKRSFREVFIDSTIVRAHQHALAPQKRQSARAIPGGLTTKIHVGSMPSGGIQGRVSAGPSPRHHPGRRGSRASRPVRGGRQGLRRDGAATADRGPALRSDGARPSTVTATSSNGSSAASSTSGASQTRYDKLVERFASFISLSQPSCARLECQHALGKALSCYAGAIRLYWPRFSIDSDPRASGMDAVAGEGRDFH